MTKKNKAIKIMRILDRLYPETPIPLKHKDKNPFTLLIAVLLSARNTDKKVNEVTPGLAYRWGLSSGRSVEQTERDLKRLFPQNRWRKLHLQMIFFGREHCPALRHRFEDRLICSQVGYRLNRKKQAVRKRI